MDEKIYKSFSSHLVKHAFVNTLMTGAMLYGMGDEVKASKKKMQIQPIKQDRTLKLQSPYNYQFSGGKSNVINQNKVFNRF